MRRVFAVAVVFALLTSATPTNVAQSATPVAQPATASSDITIQDTPTGLASNVLNYTIAEPKLFWSTAIPPCPPRAAPAAPYTQTINRIPTYNGPTRTLYAQDEVCGGGRVFSNMVADENYVYYLGSNGSGTGMVRLSVNANPGEQPELWYPGLNTSGAIADGGDRVYYTLYNDSAQIGEVGYLLKSNGGRGTLRLTNTRATNPSFDGTYLYFFMDGWLYRLKPGANIG